MGDPVPRLEDLQWLRALAGRLVRDPHTADDAVQDTLVAALERAPAEPADLRAWLATALRNVLRQEWRARGRRSAREAAAAPPRDEPSTLAVVEELALHRRLADEVHALAEPYRTAILLRYLRGRSTDEIARELGVPVKTVRTRLERGLAKLRERMERDRAAWALLLTGVPLPGTPLSLWPTLLVPMKAKLVASVVALSLVGAFFVLRGEPGAPPPSELAPTAVPSALAPLAELDPELAGRRESGTSASTPRESVPPPQRSAAPDLVVRGFVRTLAGDGLAGVEVILEREQGERFETSPESPRVRSLAGGRFELPLVEPRGRLNVRDESLAAVVTPHLAGELPLSEPILVVAPSRTYAGRVVDPAGIPIPRARAELSLDGPIVQSRDVGGTSVHLLLPLAEATADERGVFRLERATFVAGGFLEARADGFDPGRVALPAESDERLEIVLRPSSEQRQIHGIVLDPSGVPAPGARVSLGGDSATSDASGAFVLACEDWRTSDGGTAGEEPRGWLRALRRGHLPAEVALAEALQSSPERPVVLTLGRAPLKIQGRVLDADGAPVAGAAVFSPDATPFGTVEFEESAHSIQGLTTVEAFLLGSTQHPWEALPHAETGADGSFELTGLLARSYAVFALDARTLEGVGPVLLGAGASSVELRLTRAETVPVAGRVLSRSGLPLAGVSLRLGRDFAWRADDGADSRWVGYPLRAPPAAWSLSTRTVTDAEGRFEFGALVTRGTFLSVSGDALALGGRFELDSARAPGALEVVVEAASRFQVVPRVADGAEAFALETPGGEEVVLFLEVEGLKFTALRATIEGGRSGVVLVREGEYEVVLYAGDEEVQREPVRLLPGGVQQITP